MGQDTQDKGIVLDEKTQREHKEEKESREPKEHKEQREEKEEKPAKEERKANGFTGKTVLFVNSGSKKKEFILQRAKELGLTVVLVNSSLTWEKKYADHFIMADTYDHEEVLSKVAEFRKAHHLDGAVTFWEDDVPLLGRLCEKFGFLGPNAQSAHLCRDKFAMRGVFKEHEVPCPKFALVTTPEEVRETLPKIGLPAVIKPAWGSDSEFVIKVTSEEEADQVFDYVAKNATPKFNPIFKYNESKFVIEEYMAGHEVSVESVTQNGETHVVAIVDKMTMFEPYFVERGDYAPTRYEERTRRRIEEVVKKAHKAVGIMNAISHTEVKLTPNGPMVVEIATRMGGDYIWDWVRTIWEVDLVEEALHVALGLPVRIQRSREPRCHLAGKYLIPEHSGVISTLQGAGEVSQLPDVHQVFLPKRVGDTILVPPLGFESAGWIVAKGTTAVEAERAVMDAMDKLRLEAIQFTPESSIGRTIRKNKWSAASLSRKQILDSARIERLRTINLEDVRKLHVGILCNVYDTTQDGDTNEVEADLMSVGNNIKKALEARGYRVTFFDMNEDPLPFMKLHKSDVDIVFNVCERINDSSLLEPHSAAMLDMLRIPYTGSNPQTLALSIDKIRVKKLLNFHSIPTPRWDYVYSMDDDIDEDLHYPLIVKPANTDNSIGITNDSVVSDREELMKQVRKIVVDEGRPALIEEYIDGDEYDVSIMGSEDDVMVLPLSRSIFDDLPPGYWHIYPYDAKWKKGTVYDKIQVERPANIPRRLASLITEMALDTYTLLDCHDYGRVEVRVDREGNPFVLELNPNPSINREDCVPAQAELLGKDYEDFIEQILLSAIRRYRDRPPYYHLQSTRGYL